MSTTLLKPQASNDVSERLQKRKETQAKYYNRTAKELSNLKDGDTVRIQPVLDRKGEWTKGKVVGEPVNIRSYKVETEDGRTYRRNRTFLRRTKEPFQTSEVELPNTLQQQTQQPPREPKEMPSRESVPDPIPSPAAEPTRVSTRVSKKPAYLSEYVTAVYWV